jgi:glycosyltransferase involved in cell wall biosynthesis
LKASIIINSYNYGRFLRPCIDSALAQTYENTEVIVVDDGSDDSSCHIINCYGDSIAPIFKTNGGQASCFNAGFAHSQGDVIFFLDADDEFHPRKVALLIQVYSTFHVKWCFDRVDLSGIPELRNFDLTRDVTLSDLREQTLKGRVPHLVVPTSGLSFRRDLIGRILPMPTAANIVLSDNYLKFAAAGLGCGAICNAPLTHQRIHSSNRYTQSRDFRTKRVAIMMETGIQLAEHFPSLAGVGIKLTSNALAESMSLKGHIRWLEIFRRLASSFTLPQAVSIGLRAILINIRNNLRNSAGALRDRSITSSPS